MIKDSGFWPRGGHSLLEPYPMCILSKKNRPPIANCASLKPTPYCEHHREKPTPIADTMEKPRTEIHLGSDVVNQHDDWNWTSQLRHQFQRPTRASNTTRPSGTRVFHGGRPQALCFWGLIAGSVLRKGAYLLPRGPAFEGKKHPPISQNLERTWGDKDIGSDPPGFGAHSVLQRKSELKLWLNSPYLNPMPFCLQWNFPQRK